MENGNEKKYSKVLLYEFIGTAFIMYSLMLE